MISIDFGLLRSPYCKISYLLKIADVTQIIVGSMANFGKVFFIKRSPTFYFFHVFTFLDVFLKFLFERLLYLRFAPQFWNFGNIDIAYNCLRTSRASVPVPPWTRADLLG